MDDLNYAAFDQRQEYMDKLVSEINKRKDKMTTLENELEYQHKSLRHLQLRLDEARLIKDIRDGKLTVTYTATGSPVRVGFVSV